MGKRGPKPGEGGGGRPKSIFRLTLNGKRVGVSPLTVIKALLAISESGEASLTQIAKTAIIEKGVLSGLLDYLAKANVVTKRVVGRKHVYQLTDEGERFLLQLRAAMSWCPRIFNKDLSIKEKIKLYRQSLEKRYSESERYNINLDPDAPSLVMFFVALFFPEVWGFLEQGASYDEFVKEFLARRGDWPLIEDYLVGPTAWRQRIKELVEFMYYYASGSLVAEADAEELRNMLERLKRRKPHASTYLNDQDRVDPQSGCVWVGGICYHVLPKKRIMLTRYGFYELESISFIYHLYQLAKSEGEYLAYLHDHRIWSRGPPLDKQAYFARKAAMLKQLNEIRREMDRVEGEHIIRYEPQENDYSLDPSISYILESLERLNPKIYGPITSNESGRGTPFNSLAKSKKTEDLPLGLSRLQLLVVDKIFRGEFCPSCSNDREIHLLEAHLLVEKKVAGYRCPRCNNIFKAEKAPGQWQDLLSVGRSQSDKEATAG